MGEFDADESPLEPGVFLIPGGGVALAPPAIGAEQAARWNGAAWEIVPDLRGRVYWLADHTRHEITERGVALPAGALAADPPKTQAELDAEDSAAAKRELAALDLASIRDIRAYIAAKPDAPQTLKDREALAVAARARVKP
ncbi:MAG: hypothetical protein ACYCVW_17000 [Rhodocyclaceae bacterium]